MKTINNTDTKKRGLAAAALSGLMLFALAEPSFAAESESDPYALEIAQGVNKTYLGYADETVTGEMKIKSANGTTTHRSFDMTTFEVADDGDLRAVVFTAPSAVAGFVSLNHSRIRSADLQWVFLPQLDRVRRLSARDKTGAFAGSEFSYEDIVRWEVERYSYQYEGSVACAAVAGCEKLVNIPLYKHSGYSKLVEVIDMDIMKPLHITYYDRNGKAFKRLEMFDYRNYGTQMRPTSLRMTNLITGAVSDVIWSKYRFGQGLTAADFSDRRIRNWSQ